jgi:hypothetical protein
VAVAYVQEFTIVDHETKNYDQINARLDLGNPPAGLIVHTAGFDDEAGVFRIFDIWESEEAAQKFHEERLDPLIGEVLGADPTATPPTRSGFYPLHNVIEG